MKTQYFLPVLILLAVALAGTNTYAGNAYSYFNLYKNSEIYKERHPEENREKEQPEHAGPTLDGWGNLVDVPPPPPSVDDEENNYNPDTNKYYKSIEQTY